MIGSPQGWEWILILAVVILLFGAAKLPQLARGTGQALRIFKAETKGLRDDDDKPKDSSTDAESPQPRGITTGEQASTPEAAEDPAKRPTDS
ncbi:MAG: Sec-independent protein translocase subunit TatA [Nocardioidaceae bacterium]